MDHFIDIKIKPNIEIRKNVLLNQIYGKLHKTLYSLNSTEIGISFPQYKIMLGDIIRLHGTETKLITLEQINWLGPLSKFCMVSSNLIIPSEVNHRIISRKQANMTEAKLRRLIKRNSISAAEIKDYKAKMFQQNFQSRNLSLRVDC